MLCVPVWKEKVGLTGRCFFCRYFFFLLCVWARRGLFSWSEWWCWWLSRSLCRSKLSPFDTRPGFFLRSGPAWFRLRSWGFRVMSFCQKNRYEHKTLLLRHVLSNWIFFLFIINLMVWNSLVCVTQHKKKTFIILYQNVRPFKPLKWLFWLLT